MLVIVYSRIGCCGKKLSKALPIIKGVMDMNKVMISVGDIYFNRYGYRLEIVEYINYHKIKVRFHDPVIYEKYSATAEIKSGKVNTPYHRSFQGVGYIGEGEYKAYHGPKNYSKEYKIWADMLTRVYTDVKGEAYSSATVCEEWLNFQNFASWCHSQEFFFCEGYELDKDILCKGNKHYSPEFCRFVPGFINRLLINRGNQRGKYKVGVYGNRNAYKKYTAAISENGVRRQIGTFYSEDDAFLAYKEAKESHVRSIAEINKTMLPLEVYNALCNWCVDEKD